MKFKLAVILLFFATGLRGQGLVFNDEAYRSSPMQADEGEGAKGEAEFLKNNFKIDLKPYCPTVREQGKISSCVGWSVGYAAMTIERAIANKWANDQTTIDDNAFSAMFVYNQIKLGDCFFGAELNHAFGILKEKGNVFYRDFVVDNNCDSLPTRKLVQKARLHRLKDFVGLFKPDDKESIKIDRVKRTLARNKPVVIGMIVLENFLTLKSNDHVWYPSVGNTDLFGGHAMVVVGYDEGRKAFEIMNSWGKGWANQGFVWVRYDDFAKYCKYAYQLVPDKEEVNFLEGSIQILRPVVKSVSEGEANVIFSPVSFDYKNNQYRLRRENINLPLKFQLVLEGLRNDSYLYVISFDDGLKPTVHWPRDEKLNVQFAKEHQSPVVTSQHSMITLPGKYNVFAISAPATEYLCVVNSNTQIKNIPERLRQINVIKGEFQDRIRKIFNSKPAGDYSTIQNDRISFYSNSEKSDVLLFLLEFNLSN